MAIPPNKNKLRRAIIGIGAPLAWWPADPDALTLVSGAVSVAHDLVAGRAITYPAGHRPVLDVSDPFKPQLVFNLNEGGKDGGGLISGRDDVSWLMVWKDDNYNANYAFIISYQPDAGSGSNPGRSVVYTYLALSKLASYMEITAGGFNELVCNAAIDTAWHVHLLRQKRSDGVTCVKPDRADGADQASSNTSAGDATGTTFGNFTLDVGTADTTFVSGSSFPAKGKLADLAAFPYLSNAVADLVQACFKALRGTP